MADEEKNEQNEEPTAEPDAPAGEAEDAAADARAEEQPQGEAEEQPPAEVEEQDASEVPTEAPEEEAPADQQPADEGGEADDALEGLDWKARRRLERSRQRGEPQPERSPEQRGERRRAAAVRRQAYRKRARERRSGSGQGTPPAERSSVAAKVRQGRVISNKANKTITVRIDNARRHPTYEKVVRRSSTLHAHDERNEANEGDLVRLVETRPISRSKRWRLAEILEKAK